MPLLSTFGAGSTRGWGRAMRLAKPGVPLSFTITGSAGGSSATVSFTPPVDNGGATITAYRVYNLTDGGFQTVTASGQTISLPNQSSTSPQEKSFRVTAVNVAGESDPSNTDPAINFYVTTGNSTQYYVPRTTTVSWTMYSGSGQVYKPDTRTFAQGQRLNGNWFDSYCGWLGGCYGWQYFYGQPELTNTVQDGFNGYSWWMYDDQYSYIYGYYSYAGFSYYYYINAYGYSSTHGTNFNNTQIGGMYANIVTVQTGGSSASGPTYGNPTSVFVQNVGTVQSTGQGYNGSASSTSGSYTVSAGSWIRMDHGYSGGEPGYASQGYGYLYFAY